MHDARDDPLFLTLKLDNRRGQNPFAMFLKTFSSVTAQVSTAELWMWREGMSPARLAQGGIHRLLVLCVLSSTICIAHAYEIFVSPHGHDVHGDGSMEKPFQSVQAAIEGAWEYDVIVLMSGIHTSDKEIHLHGKKLAIRSQNPPVGRRGGCWPVHTGDPNNPTLTRCNISSWPQSWNYSANDDDHALDTPAMSMQTWPASFVDEGLNQSQAHGLTSVPIPSSEGGDYWDPGDAPRGNPDDYVCGPLGCDPRFHGSGNLQSEIVSDATLIGARFVLLDGDDVLIRDLDIRGSIDGRGDTRQWDAADEGGCLFVSGNANVTIVDSTFAFCHAQHGGGAVALGYLSNVWFRGVRFLNNSASGGGAVFVSMEGDVMFRNCEFSGNNADRGGAVLAHDLASPRFEACDFFSNRASTGGALMATGDALLSLSDTALFHNSAGAGAGLAVVEAGKLQMGNCTLQNNSAVVQGGAVFMERLAGANISGCMFLFNNAAEGGAIFSYAPTHKTRLAASTFLYNTASKSGAHVHPFELAEAALNGGVGSGGNSVCSGRGLLDAGYGLRCGCTEGTALESPDCEVQCPGTDAAAGSVCSGRGVCTGDSSFKDRRCRWLPGRRWLCVDEVVGQCRCDFGFAGHDCSMQCPGYLEPRGGRLRRRGVCSGHGECVLMNGTAGCDCEFGWGGTACDEVRIYALGCGGGEGAEDNRIVRLGDRVLVNSRERGLHLVALNRSDLTMVWDRSYDVAAIISGSTDEAFYPVGDIDGTVNVFEGRAGDGSDGSLNATEAGPLPRQPHVTDSFFAEGEANRLARDMSLFDARHLLILTSFGSWENHTNHAVVQAVQRMGGPDLSSFEGGGRGSGHSLVVVGVPDGSEQAEDEGALLAEASYVLGPLPVRGGRQCLAEVEVNLQRRAEGQQVRWCGQRLVRGGVDVSHLEGTRCVDDMAEDFGADAVGCSGLNCTNASVANVSSAGNLSAVNLSAIAEATDGCNLSAIAALCNSTNETACNNGSNTSDCLCMQNLTLRCSGTRRVHRWAVVPRTAPLGHHPHGQRLEGWDLDGDFDASEGPGPVLVSSRTVLQPCCNRSERWRHGGCRKGRSVAPDPGDRSRLVCFESGWEGGGGFGGVFGNIDVAGGRSNTLASHSPPRDSLLGGPSFGAFTPYLPDPGNRLLPFSQADIVPVLQDPGQSYGQEGYYGGARGRATPTPVFKACEPGVGECGAETREGLVVPGECAAGQCGQSTGEREQQRWEVDA